MGVVGLIEWAVGVGAWAGWWDEGECDKKQSTEIDMPGSRMPLASIPDACVYRMFSILGEEGSWNLRGCSKRLCELWRRYRRRYVQWTPRTGEWLDVNGTCQTLPTYQGDTEGPIYSIGIGGRVFLKKSGAGLGWIVNTKPSNPFMYYWEVEIISFSSPRLDIGFIPLCPSDIDGSQCAAQTHYSRSSAYLFDGLGRISHEKKRSSYGCKLKNGDMIGVLLTANGDLRYIYNGYSMGIAFRGLQVSSTSGIRLFPYVCLSVKEADGVRIHSSPPIKMLRKPRLPMALYDALSTWKDGEWSEPPPHPDDGKVIIEGFLLGPGSRFLIPWRSFETSGDLLEILSGITKYRTDQLGLMIDGKHVLKSDVKLELKIGKSGVNMAKVMVYPSHLVS
ncbi:hypothetical protein AAMO2058_001735900 [Amorphochlora amoebiformis]